MTRVFYQDVRSGSPTEEWSVDSPNSAEPQARESFFSPEEKLPHNFLVLTLLDIAVQVWLCNQIKKKRMKFTET
jgi:hypothetical protein